MATFEENYSKPVTLSLLGLGLMLASIRVFPMLAYCYGVAQLVYVLPLASAASYARKSGSVDAYLLFAILVFAVNVCTLMLFGIPFTLIPC